MKKLIEFIRLIYETYLEMVDKKKLLDIHDKMNNNKEYLRGKRDEVIKMTCKCSGVNYDEFMANKKCRARKYVHPRHIIMTVMHYGLMYSQEETEEYFEKGHPAVIYGKNTMRDLFQYEPELVDIYEPVLRYANSLNSIIFSKKVFDIEHYFKEDEESN